MKFLYLTLLFLLIPFWESAAQISKGTNFIGATIQGSGSFIKIKNPGEAGANQNSIALELQWGLFAKENFMIGVGLKGGYAPYTSWNDALKLDYTTNRFNYGISPFVRWYKPISSRFYFFVQPSLGAEWSREDGSDLARKTDFLARVMVAPGISYRVGKRFAIEADLNIFGMGLTYARNSTGNQISFSSFMTSNLPNVLGLRGALYLN